MIYILKASEPIGNLNNPHGMAQYYCGWCHEHCLGRRLREHARGKGAALTKAWFEQGLTFKVVLLVPSGTRELERKIKAQKNHKRFIQRYKKRVDAAWEWLLQQDNRLQIFLGNDSARPDAAH